MAGVADTENGEDTAHLLKVTDAARQAILDARVPLVTYRTLADRVGGWPEYVLILLTVLAMAWGGVLAWGGREARAGRQREADSA